MSRSQAHNILCCFFVLLIISWGGRLCAQSVGGTTSGAAAYCDSVNSGFISLSNFQGQVLFWEYSSNKGVSWNTIQNPTSTQSYNALKTTTAFRAIVKDGNFPQDTSTISTITIHVPGIAGEMKGGGRYCGSSGDGVLIVEDAPGVVLFWQYSNTGGQTWNPLSNPSFTLPYSGITENRLYRAVVETVSGCPADTSAPASFTIDPNTQAGTILGSDSLCVFSPGDTLRLVQHQGEIRDWQVSHDLGASWLSLNTSDSIYVYPTVEKTRLYRTEVKSGVCEAKTSDPAFVAVFAQTFANAGPDKIITRFESVVLEATGEGAASWHPAGSLSDPAAIQPLAQPENDQTYVLRLTDKHGCVSWDSVFVRVEVPVPTAITPNGDGVNDLFIVHEIEKYPRNTLQVYDRWGLLVYQASPYQNNWNGVSMQGIELAEGFYAYVFDKGDGEKALTNYLLIKR